MSTAISPKGTLQEFSLPSRHLGRDETVIVYTPFRYSPLYSYPVLYVQDGRDYLAMGRLATLLDQWGEDRKTQDCLAVFLPVEKEVRFARYHPDGSQHEAYKRFLAEEVVSFIDQNYSTHPLGGARTLIGESLGGVVSLFTALTYPNTFGQVAMQSGAFDQALCEAVSRHGRLDSLSVYMEVGTEETAVQSSRGLLDLVQANRELYRIMQQKGATLRFETFEGDHTWGYWQENLPRILRHFFG